MDKLDILDRGPFVEQVINLIENISDNQVSTCFAINGTWGTGKSFVLDMIEEQLEIIQSPETVREKYFVVRYNCWKYDYYEEPLIAIVSAIISEIEEKTKMFPNSQAKQEIIGMFRAAGISLLSLANTAFKAKTGLDIQSAYAEKYLEKFISFEIKLDKGSVSEMITEKHADYIEMFDRNIFQFEDSVEECLQAIFKSIDVRTQEQIVNKVTIAHKLLYKEKKDYSFMCMELILAVMIFVYDDGAGFLKKTIDMHNLENIFSSSKRQSNPAFSTFFKEKFEQISFTTRRNFEDEPRSYVLPTKGNLYGAIIFTWYWMHEKNKNTIIQHVEGDSYDVISRNHENLKKFVETLDMMR